MARVEGVLIGGEPTPGQRITDLHCWIATYADGTEGIVAAGLEGLGITTLLSSRRAANARVIGSADGG